MYRSINFNWEKKCFNGALKRFWWWFPCHIILCHSIQNEIHSDPRTRFIHTSKHSLHRSSVFLKSIIWYYRGFLIFLPNYTLFYVFYKSKKKPLHHLLLIMLKEKHGTRLLCKFTLHVMLKTVLVTVSLWYIFSKQGTK